MLKRLIVIILVLSTSLITTTSQADCKSDLETCRSDCRAVIKAANEAISARDSQISDQKNAIDDLTKELSREKQVIESDNQALSAWYHNPLILIPVSIIVGGSGAYYLLWKR